MVSAAEVKAAASAIGFDAAGVAPAMADRVALQLYSNWLRAGHNATMDYMAVRLSAGELMEGCRSVIVCLMNYYPAVNQAEGEPRIARYAYSTDYHYIMWAKLEQLAARLGLSAYKTTCDTAPLLERAFAAHAGLGWIGRNNMLINPEFGSFCFIGTILTTAELEPDAPMESRCGSCRKCIDACPTGALKPYSLDSNGCLSYRTIESKEPLTREEASHNRLFGCDICQEVCPWNRRFARPNNHPEFSPTTLDIEIAAATNSQLKRARSPLTRSSITKLKLNYNLCISTHRNS